MPNPKKPAGMDRREFLQFAGSGLLFSMLDPLTAKRRYHRRCDSLSPTGFSLDSTFPARRRRCSNQLSAQPKTGFEWARARTPLEPVFAATGKPSQKWTSSPGAREHHVDGDRFELVSQTEDGTIRSKHCVCSPLQTIRSWRLILNFRMRRRPAIAGVTAFGPFRFALRDDLGPLRGTCRPP